jgi:kinesin family member 2/24
MSLSSTAGNGRKSTSAIPTLSTITTTPATSNTAATTASIAAAAAAAAAMSSSSASSLTKDATRRKIELMEAQREQRRRDIQQRKVERKQEEERNLAAGNPGDVDFIGLVRSWRAVHKNDAEPHYGPGSSPASSTNTTTSKLCICVRKRPLSEKERVKQDHDSISCYNPHIWVHSAKYKVDGITKYLTHTSFKLDHAFNEHCSTQDVYLYTTLPLVDFVTQGTGGRATVFCYGQTGSGKTFTMKGLQHILCHDLYGQLLSSSSSSKEEDQQPLLRLENITITVAFFELYGGFIQDLLHDRQRCKLLEDAKGEVNITGLTEFEAPNPETFLALIEAGNK